jgi:uncharacterized protein YjbI with pentapeptide repeats
MAATLRASTKGLDIVDKARRMKGWAKTNQGWADRAYVSKSSLQRFWRGVAIQAEGFQSICQCVGVEDWKSIVDFEAVDVSGIEENPITEKNKRHYILDLDADFEAGEPQQPHDAVAQRVQQKQAAASSKDQREQAVSETKEEALQTYFDRMSNLLVDKNLLGIAAEKDISSAQKELLGAAVGFISASTLLILRRFRNDEERKNSVIRFLLETEVITKLKLNLNDADLSGVKLSNVNLSGADLSSANLSSADLNGAKLLNTKLGGANLNGADLNFADLSGASLFNTNLSSAELNNAIFAGAELCCADMRGAKLGYADLREADLREADLDGADVNRTRFGTGLGVSEEQKQNLIERGAIFDSSNRFFLSE